LQLNQKFGSILVHMIADKQFLQTRPTAPFESSLVLHFLTFVSHIKLNFKERLKERVREKFS